MTQDAGAQDGDRIQIYRTEYSYLIGSAILIVVAGKRERSRVFSEAFVLLPAQEKCGLWAHRFFSTEWDGAVPGIPLVNVDYMAGFARESAQAWLDSHLWERFRESGERIAPDPVVLFESSANELVSLRLRGKCWAELSRIRNGTLSDTLERTILALRTLPAAEAYQIESRE
jgi:hypothetical protein